MEYLLDQVQSESAALLLGAGLTQDALEEEIENLRSVFYRIQFGQDVGDVDLDAVSRRAYLLATLATTRSSTYKPATTGRALSVAATIFEYLSQVSSDSEDRLNYALNAIMFYSRGEQEAQSATVARKMLQSGLPDSFDEVSKEAWLTLLLFLGRQFKEFLIWGRDSSTTMISRWGSLSGDGPFWTEVLLGCLGVSKLLVWGVNQGYDRHFDNAIAQARQWGSTRLTWLGVTIKEVAASMVSKSLRSRLSELGIPGWATETLTMDGFVEMWLPHRVALAPEGNLTTGILSDEAQISLINMPTSAGKSLAAEIAILFELTKDPSSKAIWVVPSRALVFEVQSRLGAHLRRIGISVSSLAGGLEAEQDDAEVLQSARVFVLTPEKLDGLLRRSPAVLDPVRIVVVDEMQKIGEGGRGWLIETVVSWLLLLAEQNQNLRLVFMSAVLPNRPDFEVWLGGQARGFTSRWVTWRPTRLALFTTSGRYGRPWQTVLMQRHSTEIILSHDNIVNPPTFRVPLFLLQTLRNLKVPAHGILVFFYTKDDVNTFVGQVAQITEKPRPTPPLWKALSDKFAAVYGVDHPFTQALERGIGIDHGDVPLWLRQLVEGAFRSGNLPTLVANQAILEGVNFPIEDIIIGSLGSGVTTPYHFRLRLQDYINLVGRVGRAMVDTEGRCFLVWNWFYREAAEDNLSWEAYSTPAPIVDNILSSLAVNEAELTQALQRLVSSLQGIDEAAFDELGVWRDRLERLHSSALALLEQPGTVDYTRLSQWIHRTLAWQQLSTQGREALDQYAQSAWRGFQSANKSVYRLASLSGLSVRSADEIENVARGLIADWSEEQKLSFDTVFSRERFQSIVNLRECWRRRPVTYGTRGYVPNIDHFDATAAWIGGVDWTEVARIICANHENLQERTRAGIVATYVSQMFEYRLPWALGSLAAATRALDGPEGLCKFLEILPSYTRYGVNVAEAATISRLCRAERNIALTLAQKFLEEEPEHRDLKTWLQRCSFDQLRAWFQSEPDLFLRDLLARLHNVRDRDWTLRREGRVVVELAGWRNYGWARIARTLRSNVQPKFALRREPDNPFDRFATAVDAVNGNADLHVGYVPASHAEEVSDLLGWGRVINVSLHDGRSTPPQISLELLEVT